MCGAIRNTERPRSSNSRLPIGVGRTECRRLRRIIPSAQQNDAEESAVAVEDLSYEIGRAANSGRIVLVASHNLSTVERLATRVLVLRHGRIVADETMATFLRERVAELTLSGRSMIAVDRLVLMFRGAVRTGVGIDVPLDARTSMEQLLAACRRENVPVAGSRVRYRRLEELLRFNVTGESTQHGGP